jgi:hypothetical protein
MTATDSYGPLQVRLTYPSSWGTPRRGISEPKASEFQLRR